MEAGERAAPEETPVALVYDGSTYAVMMATPSDLEDFAVGFTLTEGVAAAPDQILELEVVEGPLGVEVRMWLEPGLSAALALRRRRMAGPTGCGLCGVESLEAAAGRPARPLLPLPALSPQDVFDALDALSPAQTLGRLTRAAHAAGLWTPRDGMTALREDVGRHNALDKLIGALARSGRTPAGLVVLTSRVSVEMVQKAASVGAPGILAVSAPTALAVRTAEAAGLLLIAVGRSDSFEVFCGSSKLALS